MAASSVSYSFSQVLRRRSVLVRTAASASAAAQKLPPQALVLDPGEVAGGSSSSSSSPPKTRPRITLLPILNGRVAGPGGGVEAAEAIRERAPQHVLVELCPTRYAEVLQCGVEGSPAKPPPRVDVLGNIHGGLLAHELVPVLLAARDVGAAVVTIDRSRAATRSRVAQRLWHPKLLQGLMHYAGYSLRQRSSASPVGGDSEVLRKELETRCPAAHQVLIDERCTYMAHQAHATAMAASATADVMVVCGALQLSSLAQALQRHLLPKPAQKQQQEDEELARLAKRNVPVWPLYLLAYGIIPAGLAAYAVVGAVQSILLPALFPEEDERAGLELKASQR
eukprot:TRINITY_DN64437_c0_g1_i1.p1 TRINITY_DN64437_c0_g1~~TRINITY_DN64437_c0_g1_i1.p1  ORF type:complete len:338 (+),score=71.48 TRINITY_DN64437_c0_g1_i1:44-1057(+)